MTEPAHDTLVNELCSDQTQELCNLDCMWSVFGVPKRPCCCLQADGPVHDVKGSEMVVILHMGLSLMPAIILRGHLHWSARAVS